MVSVIGLVFRPPRQPVAPPAGTPPRQSDRPVGVYSESTT